MLRQPLQARIQGGGGGPRGPWPPQKIAPPNSQARIQGGQDWQEGLAPPPGGLRGPCPPPLTKSWIRLCPVSGSSCCLSPDHLADVVKKGVILAGASNALKMWGGHCLSKHRLIQGKFMVGRCPWVPGLQGLACHSEKWGGQSICCPPLYKKWGGHVPPVPHLSTPLHSRLIAIAIGRPLRLLHYSP